MGNDIITRETLLMRLRDTSDQKTWSEFAEIYTPLIVAFCQKYQLRHADIADIVQEVLCSISLAIKNFQYNPEKGRFRSWLFTIVRNAIRRQYRKNPEGRNLSLDLTGFHDTLDEAPSSQEIDIWEIDYQRQLLAWALGKIRPEFGENIIAAFEATALQDQTPATVAKRLGMTKNAVGVAKHRVLQRLKEKVHSVDADQWEDEMASKKDRLL